MSKYRIQQRDSFWSIANKMLGDGNKYKDILDANNLTEKSIIHPRQILNIPDNNLNNTPNSISNNPLQYTVQSGDTLSKIAQSHKTTSQEILKINNPNLIKIGQVLNIPKQNKYTPSVRNFKQIKQIEENINKGPDLDVINTWNQKPSYLRQVKQNMKRFNLYEMYKGGGAIPTGTQEQYNNVVSIYQSLVSKGVLPQAALEIVNQKVAEKGWAGFATGDNKKYFNADDFADHIIDWHGRMYPDSLKAKSFEDYWKGIQITPKYKYNSENPNYKQELLKTRSGVKKRINFYRKQQGLNPLAYVPTLDMEKTNIT